MKRLLLISYYFPPSGGPGVQRVLKMARYLPACGWEPVVLTVRPEDASYPDPDPAMLDEVPSSVRVERTRAWDPYALYARLLGKKKKETVGVGFIHAGEAGWKERLAKWVRANLFLPDARVGWVPFALRRARRLMDEAPFDLVLTSGPPPSTHLVGRALARRYGVPWVADFRDPWTDISYYAELPLSGRARRFDAALERSVLDRADAVVTVSPSLKALLGGKTETPVTVVYNGFDEADFDGAAPAPAAGFVVAHTGNLTAQQNPEALWRALARLRAAGAIPALRLRFVGHVDPTVLAGAAAHGVDDLVERVPYVPHADAVGHMRGATMLLLAINRVPGAALIVTGKLFEYLAAGRPVLGVGPVPGDAAALLDETGAGVMFDWEDADGVAAYVQACYAAWEAGTPVGGANPDRAAAYSRRAAAAQLAALLDGVVAGGTAAGRSGSSGS